jgi:octopine/nopaline transport system permease protein
MIKATSLASIITLMEVTGIAQRIISETFRAVEVFICAGAIYLVINFIISRAVAALEHRLSPHLRDIPDRAQPTLLSAGKI